MVSGNVPISRAMNDVLIYGCFILQGNVIHSNISFNAFLMPGQPKIAPTLKQVQMTRHLLLDDDMKEYWGFYLLKGSKVIVSSCSR